MKRPVYFLVKFQTGAFAFSTVFINPDILYILIILIILLITIIIIIIINNKDNFISTSQ